MSDLIEFIQNSSFTWQEISVSIEADPKQASECAQRGDHDLYLLHEILKHNPPRDIVEQTIEAFENALKMKGPEGRLPLHMACEYGVSSDVIDLLISKFYGAVRAKDDLGMTPLHIACATGLSNDTVDLVLMNYPEGVDVKDMNGRTAEDFAAYLQEGEMKEKIIEGLLLSAVYKAVSKVAVLNITEQTFASVCSKMMGSDLSPLKEREISNVLSEEALKFRDESYTSDMVSKELISVLEQSVDMFNDTVKDNRNKLQKKYAKELEGSTKVINDLKQKLRVAEKTLTDQKGAEKAQIKKLEKHLVEVTEMKIAEGEDVQKMMKKNKEMESHMMKMRQKMKAMKNQNTKLTQKLDRQIEDSAELTKSVKKQDAYRTELLENVAMTQQLMDKNSELSFKIQDLRREDKKREELLKTSEERIKSLEKSLKVAQRPKPLTRDDRRRSETPTSYRTSRTKSPFEIDSSSFRTSPQRRRSMSTSRADLSFKSSPGQQPKFKTIPTSPKLNSLLELSRSRARNREIEPVETSKGSGRKSLESNVLTSEGSTDSSSLEPEYKEPSEEITVGLDFENFKRHKKLVQAQIDSLQGEEDDVSKSVGDSDIDNSSLSSSSFSDHDEIAENARDEQSGFLEQILDVDLSLSGDEDSEKRLEMTRRKVSQILIESKRDPNRSRSVSRMDADSVRSSSAKNKLRKTMESLNSRRSRSVLR